MPGASLKRNILANYLNQIYVSLVGIVMVPLYIRFMGAEAYGLVGFHAMLLSWFVLLDMGLSPTIQRETARLRGGAGDKVAYRHLFRSLEGIFLVVALVGGAAIFTGSGLISDRWLHASRLPVSEVERSIEFIAVIIAVRWMGSLYRGVILGSERLVWLGGFSSLIATVKAVGVLPVLSFIGVAPGIFFGFQCIVALVEFAGLAVFAYRLMPGVPGGIRVGWDIGPLKQVLSFSMALAFGSTVWALVTQLDRLILSNLLTLKQYGYFSVATLIASGVTSLAAPVTNAMVPRMSKLDAEQDMAGFVQVYRKSTQLVTVLAGSAAATMAFCAQPFLLAWTGDHVLAAETAPVLQLYALGNGMMAVVAFQYYLQYAKGELRLHFIWNVGAILLLVPSVIWAATRYGAVGSGYVWLGINLLSFVFWQPFVHARYEPELNRIWYFQDVLVIVAAIAITGYPASRLLVQSTGRWALFAEVGVCGLLALAAGGAASSELRARFAGVRNKKDAPEDACA